MPAITPYPLFLDIGPAWRPCAAGLFDATFPYVATAHALIILTLGLWFIVRDKQPYRLIYLTGYIAGADVLWRMTKAPVTLGIRQVCHLPAFYPGNIKMAGPASVPSPGLRLSPDSFDVPFSSESFPMGI